MYNVHVHVILAPSLLHLKLEEVIFLKIYFLCTRTFSDGNILTLKAVSTVAASRFARGGVAPLNGRLVGGA